jgi:hypothetical protein
MLSYQTIRKPCIVVNTWLVTSDAIHLSPVGLFIWKPLSRDCSLVIHLGVLLVGFVFVYLVFCFVLCCMFFCLSSSCVLHDQQAAASEAFYCVVNTRHRFKSHSWDGQILPHNVKLLNKTVILDWKLQFEEGHTMPKGKSIQRQTMVDQIQHKNQRLSNTSSMKKTGWNQMPRKGEQVLLH